MTWPCHRAGLLLVRTDSTGKSAPTWARLGPLSMGQLLHRTHTDGSPRLSPPRRPPNRAAWRFPDWTAVGFRFPGPVPRIGCHSPAVTGQLAASWVRRTQVRRSFTSRPSAPLAATLTLLASGAFHADFGWPRRWPPASAVPAVSCFARPLEAGLRTTEPFPISPFAFASDDMGEYTRLAQIPQGISKMPIGVIHHRPQAPAPSPLSRCTSRWKS